MLALLKNCNMVVTDSGGLQKEAFFSKKPVLIARDETEWVELVHNGFARIVGANKQKILQAFQDFKDKELDFSMNLFGDTIGEKMYQEIYALLETESNLN